MRVVPSETNDGEVDCVSFQLRTHGLCFVSDGLKAPSQASLMTILRLTGLNPSLTNISIDVCVN